MFLLARPDDERIRAFLAAQEREPFSYPFVGATRTQGSSEPLAGYVRDRNETELGRGDATFERAKTALRAWKQFQLGWVEPCCPSTPIEPGACIAILVHAAGLWSLNAARIVYVIDEPRRFGFAYGTLSDHAEKGEERFLVEQRPDGGVRFEILAFSHDKQLVTHLIHPYVRHLQKRFACDALASMKRAVEDGSRA